MKKHTLICLALIAYPLFLAAQQDNGFTNKAEAKNKMVNGLKEGKWVEYFYDEGSEAKDTSAPMYRLTVYKAGKPMGIMREYYKHKLTSETPYVNGVKSGIYKGYYDRGGPLYSEVPYTNDNKDGIAKQYYKSGKLQCEAPYTAGQPSGVWKVYNENGALMEETPFSNGKINGVKKSYYPDGKLKSETTYINNGIGATKNYDESGNEIKH